MQLNISALSQFYPDMTSCKALALMTTFTRNARRGTKPAKPVRDKNLSPDSKWRSFPKAPNLVQYDAQALILGGLKLRARFFANASTRMFSRPPSSFCAASSKMCQRAEHPITGTVAVTRAGLRGGVKRRSYLERNRHILAQRGSGATARPPFCN